MANELKNSTEDQHLLRPAALWAVDFVEQALPVFESHYPNDSRLREAVEAGRAYGRGKKRDKSLRVLALAAFKVGKEVDEASKYVTKAASAIAAIAYTHTDLQTGEQGVRQARHILGPVVYSALALEISESTPGLGDDIIHNAIESAPSEVRTLVRSMPPQTRNKNRLDVLFANLDSGLRN